MDSTREKTSQLFRRRHSRRLAVLRRLPLASRAHFGRKVRARFLSRTARSSTLGVTRWNWSAVAKAIWFGVAKFPTLARAGFDSARRRFASGLSNRPELTKLANAGFTTAAKCFTARSASGLANRP